MKDSSYLNLSFDILNRKPLPVHNQAHLFHYIVNCRDILAYFKANLSDPKYLPDSKLVLHYKVFSRIIG